jgi:DNA polymerase II large subunit
VEKNIVECHLWASVWNEHELLQTVTRGSVEKYADIAINMCTQFRVNDYLRGRVESLMTELNLIFRERKKEQFTLTEFMD